MKRLAKLLRCALGRREYPLPAPPPTRMLTFSPPTASGQSLRSRNEKAEGMSFTSTTSHADASLPLPTARERSERPRDEKEARKKRGNPRRGFPREPSPPGQLTPPPALGKANKVARRCLALCQLFEKSWAKTFGLSPRAEGIFLPGVTPHADANCPFSKKRVSAANAPATKKRFTNRGEMHIIEKTLGREEVPVRTDGRERGPPAESLLRQRMGKCIPERAGGNPRTVGAVNSRLSARESPGKRSGTAGDHRLRKRNSAFARAFLLGRKEPLPCSVS